MPQAKRSSNEHYHYVSALKRELPMGASSNDADRRIVIRPATLDDIGRVRNLLVATWHDTYDGLLGVDRVTETTNQWHAVDVLTTQAACPNASFLVASQSGKVVGHAFAKEQDAGVLLLSRLYVLPIHQRQGIGEELLRAAVRRHPGMKRVQLVVEARNAKALAFYGWHGFVVTGEIEEEEPRPLRMEMAVSGRP
jgi:ribosomal protein S18 acetylase RimI-like enzyme